jgi:hypothetical protein
MSESLSPFIPEFWAAETLVTLQNELVLANLVHRDFEPIVAERGDVVNTRKPSAFSANDKTPGSNVTPQDAKATNIAVTLDTHKEVTFTVSDRSFSQGLPGLVKDFIVPAAQAIAQAADVAVYNCLKANAAYSSGTIGSTPAAVSSITGVRKKMAQAKWPNGGRNLVIGPTVEDKFLQLDAFVNRQYVGGEGDAIANALLGRKYGMDIYMDQNVEGTKVQADITTPYVVNGTQTADGANKTLALKTGAGAVTAGALIQVTNAAAPAGYDEYVATGTLAGTVTVEPALKFAYTDGTTVTIVGDNATYTKLPFFTRNAVALVNRPLATPDPAFGVKSAVLSFEGISIRSIMTYDPNALGYQITLDCLWGAAPLDHELMGVLIY